MSACACSSSSLGAWGRASWEPGEAQLARAHDRSSCPDRARSRVRAACTHVAASSAARSPLSHAAATPTSTPRCAASAPPPLPCLSAGKGRTRLYVDNKPLLVSSDLMVGLPVPEEELALFTAEQRASLAGEQPGAAPLFCPAARPPCVACSSGKHPKPAASRKGPHHVLCSSVRGLHCVICRCDWARVPRPPWPCHSQPPPRPPRSHTIHPCHHPCRQSMPALWGCSRRSWTRWTSRSPGTPPAPQSWMPSPSRPGARQPMPAELRTHEKPARPAGGRTVEQDTALMNALSRPPGPPSRPRLSTPLPSPPGWTSTPATSLQRT